jgi:hypothetical protein
MGLYFPWDAPQGTWRGLKMHLISSVTYFTTMDDELERIWKEAVVARSRYHSGICLVGLRKPTINFNHDSRCPAEIQQRTTWIQVYSVTALLSCYVFLNAFCCLLDILVHYKRNIQVFKSAPTFIVARTVPLFLK